MLDLDKIEKKVRWSGYDRSAGVELILELIAELRDRDDKIAAALQYANKYNAWSEEYAWEDIVAILDDSEE